MTQRPCAPPSETAAPPLNGIEGAEGAAPASILGIDCTLFQRLIDAAPDAMVVIEPSGRIALVNQQAERLFGYPAERLRGQTVERLLPERMRAAHRHHRRSYPDRPRLRAMGSGQELLGRRSDGTEFAVEVSLSPLNSEGQSYVVSAIRDISARKQIEEDLRRVGTALQTHNHELEQFSYIASHDLQEPLRTITSFADILLTDWGGQWDSDARQALNYIRDSAHRMQGLLRALLEHSWLGSQPHPETVDCNVLLGEVLADMTTAIHETQAGVVVDDLPSLRGHRTELHALFMNLIANALKFRRPDCPPRIRVQAWPEDESASCWHFTVSDNGIGIPEQHSQRIFKVFQRLHHRDAYPGSGIGLAHCQKIVRTHGGSIWVEAAPDIGSVFHFTLRDIPAEALTAGGG